MSLLDAIPLPPDLDRRGSGERDKIFSLHERLPHVVDQRGSLSAAWSVHRITTGREILFAPEPSMEARGFSDAAGTSERASIRPQFAIGGTANARRARRIYGIRKSECAI